MQFGIGLDNVYYGYSVGLAYGVESLLLGHHVAVIDPAAYFDFVGGDFHFHRRIWFLCPGDVGPKTQNREDYAEKFFQKRLFL